MSNQSEEMGGFKLHEVSDEEQASELIPETVVAKPEAQGQSDSNIKTELLSRRAKTAIYSIGLFVAFLMIVDLSRTILEYWAIHWLLGATLLIAVLAMLGLSVRAIYYWLKGKNGLDVVHDLQARADGIRSGRGGFETRDLLDQVARYYEKTHLEERCTSVLAKLPDYSNDQERLASFERDFLVPLDGQVEDCIRRYSLQTGLAVAASSIPTLDALLTLWRNAMMINEISTIYGVQPTLANRLRVLASVAKAVAYSGLSQGALDVIDVSGIPVASLASKALQGFGAGVATARVGHLCALRTRPLPLAEPEGVFDKFLESLKLLMGQRVISRAEQVGNQ